MLEKIKSEPALVMGLVQALVVLLVSFGLQLTTAQTAAILAFTAAVLSIVTRKMVTPAKKASDGS